MYYKTKICIKKKGDATAEIQSDWKAPFATNSKSQTQKGKCFVKEDLKHNLNEEQLADISGGIVPIPTVEAAIRQEPDCPQPNSTGNEQTAGKANARFIF